LPAAWEGRLEAVRARIKEHAVPLASAAAICVPPRISAIAIAIAAIVTAIVALAVRVHFVGHAPRPRPVKVIVAESLALADWRRVLDVLLR
jgi:hypothetical protein